MPVVLKKHETCWDLKFELNHRIEAYTALYRQINLNKVYDSS